MPDRDERLTLESIGATSKRPLTVTVPGVYCAAGASFSGAVVTALLATAFFTAAFFDTAGEHIARGIDVAHLEMGGFGDPGAGAI
jgi:hypothetical protein